jgi:hypothetical protein
MVREQLYWQVLLGSLHINNQSVEFEANTLRQTCKC